MNDLEEMNSEAVQAGAKVLQDQLHAFPGESNMAAKMCFDAMMKVHEEARKVVTSGDVEESARYGTLKPPYFAAHRFVEKLMGTVDESALEAGLKGIADEAAKSFSTQVQEHLRTFLISDEQSNVQTHISNTVNETIAAILAGEEWALRAYPLAKSYDGKAIRARMLREHAEEFKGLIDEVLVAEVAELRKEVRRLQQRYQ